MILKNKLFDLLTTVPKGKVVYFGQLGREIGTNARTTGWILSGMPQSQWELVPWWRVVAKTGYISTLKLGFKGDLQKELLKSEGVKIEKDFVNMQIYLYSFPKSLKT